MSRLSYGQVELQLGDETLTLKPTLAALEKIDRHFGSIREAIVQVGNLSLTAMVVVIVAGSGLVGEAAKEVSEKVFRAGLVNVAAPLSDYLTVLLNPSGRSVGGGGEGKH